MTQAFDKNYWESRWQQATGHAPGRQSVANPYLARELAGLVPGTALDAGCGAGAEAIWLATEGWQVSAADISTEALARAADSASTTCEAPERVQWIEADLTTWEPGMQFELVTTHYAHPKMPQLAFYERISGWVAAGGTLLIVGHLRASQTQGHAVTHDEHRHGHEGHGQHHLEEVSVNAVRVAAALDAALWNVVTADETTRIITNPAGRPVELHDVVVRAIRRP